MVEKYVCVCEQAHRQKKLNIQFPPYNESSIMRLLLAHKRPINANENWNIKKKNSNKPTTKPMKSHIIRNAANKSQIISVNFAFFSSYVSSLILFNFANSCCGSKQAGAKLSASIRKFDNWLKIAANILNYHVRINCYYFQFCFSTSIHFNSKKFVRNNQRDFQF